jgi:hypothetical protein
MMKTTRKRWAGLVAHMREISYNILVGKPERKRTVGRPVTRCDIKNVS